MKKIYASSWLISLFFLFGEFAHGGNPACNVGEGSSRCVRVPCPTYVNFQPVSIPNTSAARRAAAADLAYANVNVAARTRLKKEDGILLESEPIIIDREDYVRLAQPGNQFTLLLSEENSQLTINIGRADDQQAQRWVLPGNLSDRLPLGLSGDFIRPDEVPVDLRFDETTHVLRLSDGQTTRYQSFQVKTDEVDLLGYSLDRYDTDPNYKISNNFLNTSKYSDLPLNLGDAFQFVNEIVSTDRSERVETRTHLEWDAYGVLETPNGTFNALRFTSQDTTFSYQGFSTSPNSQSVSQRVGWVTKEGVLFDGQIQSYDPGTGQATLAQMNYQTVTQPMVPVSVSVSNPLVTTAISGQPFSQTFTASGGTAPYRFILASGSLPPSLSLATDGTLSGTPTQTGSFTITVAATDADSYSGVGDTYTLTVIDQTPTITGFAANSAAGCVGNPVTFTATIGNGTGSYSYTLSNGTNVITGSSDNPAFSQSVTATGTGTQNFTLTVSANGQSASRETALMVNPLPVATLTTNGSTTLTCAQTQIALFAGGGDRYTFAGPGIVSQEGRQALVNVAGVYSVTVTSSSTGCFSTTSITISQDNTAPAVTITANPSLTITQGQSATLAASVSGRTAPLTYGWSTGASTPDITATTAGPYSVTVSGANGCSASATTTLSVTTAPGQPTGPFAITGVTTVSCAPILPNRFSVSFTPRYDGLSGQPVSFSVSNELLPTSQPGPYTLQLYSDNPVITLSAVQSGVSSRFAYNWLAACQSATTPNSAPRVVRDIPGQTVTVGSYFAYVIPEGAFTDTETPGSLKLTASGLPAGLSFAGATLSGTPATTVGSPFSITITATDPGGLSASTVLSLTVQPASGTPPPTMPFAITGVTTISCTPVANRINLVFAPRYAGMSGQSIAFAVVNELAPTTDAGPYSLTLYRDNPVITLKATQTGSAGEASFAYDWLAACATMEQDNTPPRVNQPVTSQTVTVGQAVNLNLANTFADQETPNQLSLRAAGLPAGLSLSGSTISGTASASGVSTVTLTATDPGSLSVSTSFTITVVPASIQPPTLPVTESFSLTGVTTVSCEVVSAGQRRVAFTPRYSGVSGSPISFSVVNELSPTTALGPYSSLLYTDNPVITLNAEQGLSLASYRYNWLAACSASGRQGAPEVSSPLRVTVLGNPVQGQQVVVEVRGAEGQPLQLTLTNLQGQVVSERVVEQAVSVETQSLPVSSQPAGLLLLRVSTPTQSQILNVLNR